MKRILLALLLTLTACTSNTEHSRRTTVTVFAAASLTKAFAAEGKAFESTHPGVSVTFSFAGSQSLVAQVEQGAPADVLATADLATIEAVRDKLDAAPIVFAHNQLAIITAPGNPMRIQGLADLARPGIKLVLAGPTVPVGKASAKALKAAGVTVHPVSLEDAVTGVVGKVALGEADAGIAYLTDLRASGATLEGVAVRDSKTDLAIATLNHEADSVAFIAFVRSKPGQAILQAFGFQ